jgi:pimeloyl-ACP methyl ester carboxylesterase
LRLNYLRRGEGEPLVLLHPLGGELVVWEPVLDRLAAERDVIALDMPGFGASPPLANGADPTPQGLAAGVGAFLDSLGVGEVHVAGNSLGAWVGIELARQRGARSVTGLSPAGFWRRPLGPRPARVEPRTLARLLLPLLPLLTPFTFGRRLLLGGVVARPERVPAAAARRLVRAYARSPAFVRANLAMRAAVIEHLHDLSAPLTLAWGEHDRLVREPKQPVPGARSLQMPGCGHIPTWDDPELVAGVLLESSRNG